MGHNESKGNRQRPQLTNQANTANYNSRVTVPRDDNMYRNRPQGQPLTNPGVSERRVMDESSEHNLSNLPLPPMKTTEHAEPRLSVATGPVEVDSQSVSSARNDNISPLSPINIVEIPDCLETVHSMESLESNVPCPPQAIPIPGPPFSVRRDVRTVPKIPNSNLGNPFLSAKFTADLQDYQNKNIIKDVNPKKNANSKKYVNSIKDKNSNTNANLNKAKSSSKDDYSGPFQNLPLVCKSDKIRRKLEEIYAYKNLSPNELDKWALDSVYKLSENDALDILDVFSQCNFDTIINKSAYLCSIIKSKTNSDDNHKKASEQAHPLYFDSTPLIPSTNSSTQTANADGKLFPQSSLVNNVFPLNQHLQNQISEPLAVKEESSTADGITNKENPLLNFDPFCFANGENPIDNKKSPPSVKFQEKSKTSLSKIVRNKSMKPKSTKSVLELERIANNLTNCLGNESKPRPILKSLFGEHQSRLNLSNENETDLQTILTLEECILKLENIDVNNKNMISSLQPALLHNLQMISTFLNLVKGNLNMNENVLNECNNIKENISIIAEEKVIDHPIICKLPGKIDIKKDYPVSDHKTTGSIITNCGQSVNDPASFLTGKLRITDKKNAENEGNVMSKPSISLNTFTSLLDKLSPELQNQKKNIGLLNDNFFCYVCNRRVSFALLNLEEHLRGKNHQINLKVNNTDCTEKKTTRIGENQLGILNMLYDSHKTQLSVPFQIYICMQCDHVDNNENEAKSHVNHASHKQIGDTTWRFCEVCPLNIYGTSEDFKLHCLTKQHQNMMKLRNVNEPQELFNASPVTDGEDQKSVCSSKSDASKSRLKLTPHEILLAIAEQKKLVNNRQKVGLYCQMCKKYYLSPSNINHIASHNTELSKCNQNPNYFCYTCNVDLFGMETVWIEHVNLETHKKLAKKDNLISKHKENESELSELSDKEGPYFEMMTKVVEKHRLTESPINTSFGIYCHPCQTYVENEEYWASIHESLPFHICILNSVESVGKPTLYDCVVCNIRLFCEQNVFDMHKKSAAHLLIKRKKDNTVVMENPDLDMELPKEDNTSSNGTNEDSDDCDEDVLDDENGSQVSHQNLTDKNPTEKRERCVVPNGIFVSGLPSNATKKDIMDNFRCFGRIEHVFLQPNKGFCQIIFLQEQSATQLVNVKLLDLRDTKITIRPLLERNRRRRGGGQSELTENVESVLMSRSEIDRCVELLQRQAKVQSMFFNEKSCQIRQDIMSVIDNCKVHFFGSQVTGLATDNSDFDIYIDFDNRSFFKELPRSHQEMIITKLLAEFTKPGSSFHVKEPVLSARVPIIRTIHLGTNTVCDISCTSGLSVENSQLVKLFLSFDPRVRWLVMFVKWWMRANGLLDPQIFTSFATTWLVLFFLMRIRPPVLCSVAHLQQNCPNTYSIANWDCRFSRNIQKIFKTENKQTCYHLLAEFFKFYALNSFKQKVLCPLTAWTVYREQFEKKLLTLPKQFDPYKNKIASSRDAEKLRLCTPICLQDPFDLSHNLTKGVSNVDLKRFRNLCLQSARQCEAAVDN